MPLMIRLNRVMQVPDSEVDTYLSNGYRLYAPEENERDNKKPGGGEDDLAVKKPIRPGLVPEGPGDKVSPYAGMDVVALKAYAAENGYDIGNAASVNGIIKKIEEAKAAASGGGAE